MRVGDGTPGPGRPTGSKNKIPAAVKEVFEAAFTELQQDHSSNLLAWAKNNPGDFYKLASKLIPSTVNANVSGSLDHILASLPVRGRPANKGSDS